MSFTFIKEQKTVILVGIVLWDHRPNPLVSDTTKGSSYKLF